MSSITVLLEGARQGDKSSEEALFNLIYEDLRALAHRHLGGSGPQRLQTTSLIHETYLRVAGGAGLAFRDRGHLFAVASRAMRQITVDKARAALTHKRGAGQGAVTLDPELGVADVSDQPEYLIALDQALCKLGEISERMAQLVELRFFGGFELEEIAPLLGVTARTLKRDWRVARAVLYEALDESEA